MARLSSARWSIGCGPPSKPAHFLVPSRAGRLHPAVARLGSRSLACRPLTGLWLPAAARVLGPGDRPGKALLAYRI